MLGNLKEFASSTNSLTQSLDIFVSCDSRQRHQPHADCRYSLYIQYSGSFKHKKVDGVEENASTFYEAKREDLEKLKAIKKLAVP